MPGGVPVATFRHRQTGAINAALFAASLLAQSDARTRRAMAKIPHRADEKSAEGHAAVSAGQAIHPGKTIGVLGGGQLWRMLAQAANRLGYRVQIYESRREDCPAGAAAYREINAPYEDLAALTDFARSAMSSRLSSRMCRADSLQAIEPLACSGRTGSVLWTSQNRSREKRWLRDNQFPHARFREGTRRGRPVSARSACRAW